MIAGTAILLDHPDLIEGWHNLESDGHWKTGGAVVPKSLLGGSKINVAIAATPRYRVAETMRLTKRYDHGAAICAQDRKRSCAFINHNYKMVATLAGSGTGGAAAMRSSPQCRSDFALPASGLPPDVSPKTTIAHR